MALQNVRCQSFWYQSWFKLSESLAHLVNYTMLRACCDASVALRMSFVWSFPFVVEWLCHVQSRHQTVWRCSGSHDIADHCSDRRRLWFALSGHQAESSFRVRCGSSRSDATVRSCLGFGDDTAHHESASCLCPAAMRLDHQRHNWSHCRSADAASARRGFGHSPKPLTPIQGCRSHPQRACLCRASTRWCSGCNHPRPCWDKTIPSQEPSDR